MQPYYDAKDAWTHEEWALLLSIETHLRRRGIDVRVPAKIGGG